VSDWEVDAMVWTPPAFEVVWSGEYDPATDQLIPDPYAKHGHWLTCSWCGGPLVRHPESRWQTVCQECEF
jgi:hypothetical protein